MLRVKKVVDYIKKKFPTFFQMLSYMKFHRKNHRLFLKDNSAKLIICFDEYGLHGGLADRLKGIVSAYHLAVQYQYQFKIHFTNPFQLEVFLEQSIVKWKPHQYDLQWSIFSTTFIRARDHIQSVEALIANVQKKKKRVFLYTNIDCLDRLYPSKTELNEIWKQTYHRLFLPSRLLSTELSNIKRDLKFSKDSAGFHARFTTLLGDFTDVTERSISANQYEDFMNIVWEKMKAEYHVLQLKQALIFSDSKRFLDFVNFKVNRDTSINISVVPGEPTHSDRRGSSSERYLKTIVDFYLLADTGQIVLFKTGKMYQSAFSRYAAISSGTPFKVIEF